jgi:hypothetical protein
MNDRRQSIAPETQLPGIARGSLAKFNDEDLKTSLPFAPSP